MVVSLRYLFVSSRFTYVQHTQLISYELTLPYCIMEYLQPNLYIHEK